MVKASAIQTGWHYDPENGRLNFYYRGTRVGDIDAGGLSLVVGTLDVQDGGAVTQATSRATGVTLSTHSGKVTTTASSLAALAIATHKVTNTLIAATDVVILSKVSGDVDTFAWVNAVAAGSFDVTLRNSHATGADTTAFVYNFVVIKGAVT